MTNYYNQRVNANRMIDNLVSKETPIENIYFKIDTCFGFSEKFVDKRIERLKNVLGRKKINKGNKENTGKDQ